MAYRSTPSRYVDRNGHCVKSYGTLRDTHWFLFQRHDAQLVMGNANCFMQGWTIEV